MIGRWNECWKLCRFWLAKKLCPSSATMMVGACLMLREIATQHLLDPLATGAVLFGRGDFKSIAGSPREETLWLLGEAGLEEFSRLPAIAPKRNSIALQASGAVCDER